MTNHPNRSNLTAILAACEADRIAAGVRRDGCGTAHITPVLNLLNALVGTCANLSSARYLRIAAEQEKARVTALYCKIHDAAARGELDSPAYDAALATLRAQIAKHDAAAA